MDNKTNNILEDITNQFALQQQELDRILETIDSFVSTYAVVKESLNKLNIPNEYNFVEDLKEIKNKLSGLTGDLQGSVKISQQMNDDFKQVQDKFAEIKAQLTQIEDKYQTIVDGQKKIESFINGFESLAQSVENLKVINQEQNINKYCKTVDGMVELVNEKLIPVVSQNNQSVKNIETTIVKLLEDKEAQQKSIADIAIQFVTIGRALETLSKTSSIDKAVLFALFDEWQEQRQKDKKKK